jgi:hypothetical protein
MHSRFCSEITQVLNDEMFHLFLKTSSYFFQIKQWDFKFGIENLNITILTYVLGGCVSSPSWIWTFFYCGFWHCCVSRFERSRIIFDLSTVVQRLGARPEAFKSFRCAVKHRTKQFKFIFLYNLNFEPYLTSFLTPHFLFFLSFCPIPLLQSWGSEVSTQRSGNF